MAFTSASTSPWAKIRAWVEYITYIEKRGRATPDFLARHNGWQVSWEIDWCFHKCGEASDLIRKPLSTEIPKYKEQRAMLGDISTIAREAGGWSDAFLPERYLRKQIMSDTFTWSMTAFPHAGSVRALRMEIAVAHATELDEVPMRDDRMLQFFSLRAVAEPEYM